MNLAQLRYFKKLAEVEHYTKAAEALFITQPALSNSIKQLERELGVPLFEPTGRNVRLTKWGREYYEYVAAGLHSIDKGTSIAQEHASSLSGTVDVGTVYTVQDSILPRLLQEYRSRYGGAVDVRLYQGLTKALVEKVEQGAYDLALCARVEHRPNLEFVPLGAQDLVAVVHEDHPLAGRSAIALSDMGDAPVVTYRQGTTLGDEVRGFVEQCGTALNERQWCDDEITLGSVIAADPSFVGISLDTLGLAPFPQLRTVRLEEAPAGFHPIYLVYDRNRYQTRAVENMIALARDLAGLA